ncbi:antitoxin Xre/MbcA/ParS toxin-binding domain-containing protein [Rhizobium sp. Leaf383]|uniref:antitoxin Xre/MbcA/ParS toxin-binding domain-containing protein n=1 Tax=Rhizobium sp. Leaf383 TaxID=1736357 RepID=UPI0009EB14A1|nr:antitoxin Xre/MbcA/ParS toxin-binding domain-containing protein [Rhizobium sp. Leaf383]
MADDATARQGGRIPSELAAESAEGNRKAQTALSQVREVREAEEHRKANVQRLEDEAYRRISKQEVAQLWLNSSNKDLGGLKPVECCKDEKPLKRVMEVLNAFVDSEQKRRRR